MYNITVATARKWKGREDSEDRSHRPHTLKTTLTPAQELLVVELRRMVLLPLDDLLAITREFINAAVSRSGLDRWLRRHGVSDLKSLLPQVEGETPPLKTFKDYEPGFVHIDIKYLPQMPDETQRRYLFVAIDRATRWVYFRIYKNQTEVSSTDFLRRLKKVAPMKIQKILTDNGSQFTDRFTAKDKRATGQHAFDVSCAQMGIVHRLSPPRHPQTLLIQLTHQRPTVLLMPLRDLKRIAAEFSRTTHDQRPPRNAPRLACVGASKVAGTHPGVPTG